MVYAKQVKNGEVIAVTAYDFEPQFSEDSNMVIITEEEYIELEESLKSVPEDTDEITDSEALNIILGNEVSTNET